MTVFTITGDVDHDVIKVSLSLCREMNIPGVVVACGFPDKQKRMYTWLFVILFTPTLTI